MKPISAIAAGIRPSATLAIDSLAKQMKADGIDVIGFGAGEPDFNTPDYIKDAARVAIENNQTRYTPATGTLALKQGICDFMQREFGLSYKPENICVTSGAKHNIFITLCTLLNPGDEVILPAPYWVTYEEAIRMAGGVPVIIETSEETSFKISPEMLSSHITDKTKAMILTSPSHPTGMVYSKAELSALVDVAISSDLYIISDEIYHFLTYKGEFTSIASLSEEAKKHTIIINGVSKTFAMTGWRIGWTACDASIAKVMSNYLSHSTGNACAVSQAAALAAVAGSHDVINEMKAAFDERRKYFVERVNAIDGVSCLEPEGAFYIFMNIKSLIGRTFYGTRIESSTDFASCLLKNGLVAVVPGAAFGAEGYVRWSYAVSMENIKRGLDRLEDFLAEK